MQDTIHLPAEPRIVFKEGNRAVFEFAELYPGYGITLGNALRRVLLSSIPGAALTSAKIEGIHHEFSTLPNILEDIIEITLNLKQVRLQIKSESLEPQILQLKAKGEKEITAGDIKCPALVEIINKDLHIATLTSKSAELSMELIAEKGIGYVSAPEIKKEKLPIGVITLDAIFTPIKKVNFEVENMRVGGRTDFNQLRVDVETDGTIAPEEAFNKACDVLISHFSAIKIGRSATAPTVAPSQESAFKGEFDGLGLSTRTLNALQRNNIKAIEQLRSLSATELKRLKGLGKKGIGEIQQALGR